jgi:hypothetical protein
MKPIKDDSTLPFIYLKIRSMTTNKNCKYTPIRKHLHFWFTTFSFETWRKFLRLYKLRAHVNMSILCVALLCAQLIKSRYFILTIASCYSSMLRKWFLHHNRPLTLKWNWKLNDRNWYWTQNICQPDLCHSRGNGRWKEQGGNKMPYALSLAYTPHTSTGWPPTVKEAQIYCLNRTEYKQHTQAEYIPLISVLPALSFIGKYRGASSLRFWGQRNSLIKAGTGLVEVRIHINFTSSLHDTPSVFNEDPERMFTLHTPST